MGAISSKQLEEFVIKKKITQPPEEYDKAKSLPLHVQIYQDLKNAGHEVWVPFVVRYVSVISDGQREAKSDGVAIDLFAGSGREIDRQQYWNIEVFGKFLAHPHGYLP